MARQSRARDVSRPRFWESGSSKVVTSTQEPNRTALIHFSLLGRRTVKYSLLYIFALKRPNFG